MAVIVYLHGVGGPTELANWLEPLNVGLGHLGVSPINVQHDQVLDIDYSEVLRAPREDAAEAPASTLLGTVPESAEDRFRRMTEQARLAVQRFGGSKHVAVRPELAQSLSA